MTARADDIAARLHRARTHLTHGLAELADLERHAPAEVAALVSMLVAHLRSWHPEAVAPIGAGWPPTTAIRDPRSAP